LLLVFGGEAISVLLQGRLLRAKNKSALATTSFHWRVRELIFLRTLSSFPLITGEPYFLIPSAAEEEIWLTELFSISILPNLNLEICCRYNPATMKMSEPKAINVK
jgi:hypothetical protein